MRAEHLAMLFPAPLMRRLERLAAGFPLAPQVTPDELDRAA
ncbi:hypothetical protein [Nonomuraea basaltis]|nr:hypothetical protein [Nonomuraea basaltis]